jgi:hypothetical protein
MTNVLLEKSEPKSSDTLTSSHRPLFYFVNGPETHPFNTDARECRRGVIFASLSLITYESIDGRFIDRYYFVNGPCTE